MIVLFCWLNNADGNAKVKVAGWMPDQAPTQAALVTPFKVMLTPLFVAVAPYTRTESQAVRFVGPGASKAKL